MSYSRLGVVLLLASAFLGSSFVIWLLIGLQSPNYRKQAEIRVIPTDVYLGRFFAGDESPDPVSFEIRNEGTGTLVIEEVIGLCGCESFELAQPTIPPGGRAALHVRVRTSGSGPLSAAVILRSNDPSHPATRLTLNWELRNVVACVPSSLILHPAEDSLTSSATASIVTYRPDRIRQDQLVTIDCWPSGATAQFESEADETSAPVESVDTVSKPLGSLNVRLDERVVGNRGSGWVRLRFSDSPESISIPILWNRFPPLRAVPPLVSLGMLDPGGEVRRTIKVVSRTEDKFAIARIAPSAETMMVVADRLNALASEHVFDVVLRAPDDAGAYRESISIIADTENSAPVVVLFSGVVRAK